MPQKWGRLFISSLLHFSLNTHCVSGIMQQGVRQRKRTWSRKESKSQDKKEIFLNNFKNLHFNKYKGLMKNRCCVIFRIRDCFSTKPSHQKELVELNTEERVGFLVKGKPWTKAQKKKGQEYLCAYMGTVKSETISGAVNQATEALEYQELDCCKNWEALQDFFVWENDKRRTVF